MNPQNVDLPISASLPCDVCHQVRDDQVRQTSNGRAVYIALTCDECWWMVCELDTIQGLARARVFRLVPEARRTGAF